jgi:hypothetical protein
MTRLLLFAFCLGLASPAALAQRTQTTGDRETRITTRTGYDRPAMPDTQAVDVYLDVPSLSVESITLDVEEVRARLSLDARVANLVQLTAGADVQIGQVRLEIQGVQAEAYLRIDLDNVAYIIDRTLTTLENNPELIETLGNTLNQTVGTVGDVADTALGPDGAVGRTLNHVTRPDGLLSETVNQAGQTVRQTLSTTGQITSQTLDTAGNVVSQTAGGTVSDLTNVVSETAGPAGSTVRRVRDQAGNVIEYTLSQGGAVSNARVVERAAGGRR